MDFIKFKTAVAHQFSVMGKHQLFYTTVAKDAMWDAYLASFPEGSNPLFRERTEHDCSCCRSFVKTVGNVVAIIDGKMVSIWDTTIADPAYQAVADAMSALVKGSPIGNAFLHTEKTVGANRNYEELGGAVKTWEHFFVNIPHASTGKNFVCKGDEIGPRQSKTRSSFDVLLRSLTEISDDAIATVLDLIAQKGALYRGEEHKFAVTSFRKLKHEFDKIADDRKELFVWSVVSEVPESVCRMRNTAIGTLLCDISEGYDLDDAVRSFERKVAPENYQRPTALVTKAMVEKAKATIEELGLTSALARRYARLTDITINDLIFADRRTKQVLETDVFDLIDTKGSKVPKNLDKVTEVTIADFLRDIVPGADSIEIMFDNDHVPNLVSLIAPDDPTANPMFKWGNRFSWDYNGGVADSIKQRVKNAGGNVVGDLCCRLSWRNHDDLDAHMLEPGNYEIYYGNRGAKSPCGGTLDVDMNAGVLTRTPVENIVYASARTMKEGQYTFVVENYNKRETNDVGFEVEIDCMGTIYHFDYPQAVKSHERIVVAKFRYSRANGLVMIDSLPSTKAAKTVWNINTQDFHKVSAIMLSPNFWGEGEGVGNKHYFFMIDGCRNDGQARGFFNEFLKPELTPHRKVIEMVGAKMKTDNSDDQLSGLGFSSTMPNTILVKVNGAFSRLVKVVV